MAAERVRLGRRPQRGETLIESLVALTILSLVAAASFVGLRTALSSSSQHKEGAVAETLLRSAAERIQDPESPYVQRAGCGATSTYSDLPTRTGYPIAVSVRFWSMPTAPITNASVPINFTPTCPVTDPGLQRVVLSITTPSGFNQVLDVLKRAN